MLFQVVSQCTADIIMVTITQGHHTDVLFTLHVATTIPETPTLSGGSLIIIHAVQEVSISIYGHMSLAV